MMTVPMTAKKIDIKVELLKEKKPSSLSWSSFMAGWSVVPVWFVLSARLEVSLTLLSWWSEHKDKGTKMKVITCS